MSVATRNVRWTGGSNRLPSGWERTLSVCPECVATVPAVIEERAAGVVLAKTCPEHGSFETLICNDIPTYTRLSGAPRKVSLPAAPRAEREQGCPSDCGLCTAHDQRTCLAIMEITSRCDLGCPICLASSGPEGVHLAPAVVDRALATLVRTEGPGVSLQFSGGEPTGHPELVSIVERATVLGFSKIEIDTNGLVLADDPNLADRLRDAGLTGIYLQMDSLRGNEVRAIRGRDIVAAKVTAIDRCRAAGLEIVLSVTVVPGVNDGQLWDMIRFGVDRRLTGVNFQPVALSGRFPPELTRVSGRFTLGHFLAAVEQQSDGVLLARDLLPIPCPDTRCGVMAYALIHKGELIPLHRLVGEQPLLEPMADFSDWSEVIRRVAQAPSCCDTGCGSPGEPLASLLPDADYFSIGCHAMMDAYSFDYERARRCCVHELTPAGTLIPFCLYNIKYRTRREESAEWR
jgi:uncharacterized radical SAM superfamily Fe-S cluster-containing enzyme